eukprot:gnl/Chilomastix_cuspidata/608.p1 GENE.gnl/Chilomastix_cuspidata/608~~gnl/Chilomastix_cuspidata/608.p1  ORF type:complete len:1549 (+),score=531.98 gnl/Chilomastix_cuspidata/608:31-4677(+)
MSSLNSDSDDSRSPKLQMLFQGKSLDKIPPPQTTEGRSSVVVGFGRASAMIDRLSSLRAESEMIGKPIDKDIIGSALGNLRQSQKVIETVEKINAFDLHTIPLAELAKDLKTNFETGLSSETRAALLREQGPNKLSPPKKKSWIVLLLKCFAGFFSILLWIGALLAIGSYVVPYLMGDMESADKNNLYIGIVLAIVVILTGLFTFYQEMKSLKIMEGFNDLVPESARVLVDGDIIEIDVESLVLGDIVQIQQGDKNPADLRLFKVDDLTIDLSSLTGESKPIPRKIEHENPDYLRCSNVCYFSSYVLSGNGFGVVIARGDDTAIGHISTLAKEAEKEKSPIKEEINRFVFIISAIAIVMGIVFLVFGLIDKSSTLMEDILFTIGIIVANVPEGLLATVTVGLSLTARAMSKQKVLVKTLESVETLGSTSVICSDKTGTITQNVMSLQHMLIGMRMHEVNPLFEEDRFDIPKKLVDPAHQGIEFQKFLRCASICSRAIFDTSDPTQNRLKKKIIGDATEAAILRFCSTFPGFDLAKFRDRFPKFEEIAFNSVNKFQVSIHRKTLPEPEFVIPHPDVVPPEGLEPVESAEYVHDVIVIKGAPERIIQRCQYYLHDGRVFKVDEEFEKGWRVANKTFASCGERVLAFAEKIVPYINETDFDSEDRKDMLMETNDFVFLGFTSMMDPPREGVLEAVRQCRTAAIKVVMVTGDQPDTARAIGAKVDILTAPTLNHIAEEREIDINGIPPREVEKRLGFPPREAVTIAVEKSKSSDEVKDNLVNAMEESHATDSRPELSASTSSIPSIQASSSFVYPKGIVVYGPDMNKWPTDELLYVCAHYTEIIFARTSPEQKLRIVQTFQSLGNIVACSGDGCFAKGTPVLLHDGSEKPVEEVEEGDVLMGPGSQPRPVVKLYSGVSPAMYRVGAAEAGGARDTFDGGFTVNSRHALYVADADGTEKHVPVEDVYKRQLEEPDASRRYMAVRETCELAFHSAAAPWDGASRLTKDEASRLGSVEEMLRYVGADCDDKEALALGAWWLGLAAAARSPAQVELPVPARALAAGSTFAERVARLRTVFGVEATVSELGEARTRVAFAQLSARKSLEVASDLCADRFFETALCSSAAVRAAIVAGLADALASVSLDIPTGKEMLQFAHADEAALRGVRRLCRSLGLLGGAIAPLKAGGHAFAASGEQLRSLAPARADLHVTKPAPAPRLVAMHIEELPAAEYFGFEVSGGEGAHAHNVVLPCAVITKNTNDAPALSGADIGVAMMAGSDVSHQAADMILLDNSFASIVTGVREGRRLFDNLKKSICYTLTSNIPEIIPFILFIIMGMPLALPTVLILCVDVGTDMFPAISFAYEPAEDNLMKRPPRRRGKDRLVNWQLIFAAYGTVGIIQALAGLASYLFVMWQEGVPLSSIPFNRAQDGISDDVLATAQTAYFFSIIVVQLANAIAFKTRFLSIFRHGILRNRIMLISWAFELALGLMIVYIPWLNTILGSRPLRGVYLLPAIPFAILIFVYDETRKKLLRRGGLQFSPNAAAKTSCARKTFLW